MANWRSPLALAAFSIVIVAVATAILAPSATPSAEAQRTAAFLAAEVSAGRMSDCEALARFAEAPGRTVADWNVFVPAGKVNWPLGAPIALVGVAQPVKLEGVESGYLPRFRKDYGPGQPEGRPHDQAHHFAPYFILGARIPIWLALPFLRAAEREESWGDLMLGREALRMGSMGTLSGFRESLCRA